MTPEQQEFAAYAERWIAENQPAAPPFRLPLSPLEVMTVEQRDFLQEWQHRCYEAGLVGCDYPREYGGGGHRGFQALANRALGRAGAPFLINVIALNMTVPTLLEHGSEEQKRRFLPRCFSGEELWCQGFSEPGAGSDLANQQTFAERDGDGWIVNGHKVWTSLGHFAHWMILLCRTGRESKYGGLSYFLAPIAGQPGVTVRPLIKLTGETGFNEVLFEDVRIDDSLRVGPVGGGWQVAMTTLLHERGASTGGAGGGRLDRPVRALIELARQVQRDGRPAAQDPVWRDQIVRLAIQAESIRLNHRRAQVPALCDHPMRLPLQVKLTFSELEQAVARLGVSLAGAAGTLHTADPHAPDGGHWPLSYLNSFGATIAAGTSEIQRNILGERVLGLEKTK